MKKNALKQYQYDFIAVNENYIQICYIPNLANDKPSKHTSVFKINKALALIRAKRMLKLFKDVTILSVSEFKPGRLTAVAKYSSIREALFGE